MGFGALVGLARAAVQLADPHLLIECGTERDGRLSRALLVHLGAELGELVIRLALVGLIGTRDGF